MGAIDSQAVILTAGRGSRIAIADPGQPKALLRVGDMPVVVHQLVWLRRQGCTHVVIVHAPGDRHRIELVIDRSLRGLPIDVIFVEQPHADGPGAALRLAAPELADTDVTVLTADTYFDLDEPLPPCDTLAISDVDDNVSYCLVRLEGDSVLELVDKPHAASLPRMPALIGLYRFGDGALLRKVLRGSEDGSELKPIIDGYRSCRSLEVARIASWRDLGSYRGFVEASRSALRGRCFHEFSVDRHGSVTKRGPIELMKREGSWFQSLPPVARALTPALRSWDSAAGEMVLDLLDYPTLSSIWLFEDHPTQVWTQLLDVTIDSMEAGFWSTRKLNDSERAREWCQERYIYKTIRRLKRWEPFDSLRRSDLTVNGTWLPAFDDVWARVLPCLVEVSEQCLQLVPIHGDATLSNILLARHYGFVRFIDPTSTLTGSEPWGDPRYDMAKLRQCYSGRYDTLARGLFICQYRGAEVHLDLYGSSHSHIVAAMDDTIAARGFDLAELRLIEALQFLSMGALHRESPERQLAMYVIGLRSLHQHCEAQERRVA
jgi:dTDP-glucose pyrophosphorylase